MSGYIALHHGFDRVIGLVHGGTREIVHGRVDDRKVLLSTGLQKLDAREQDARIADQRTPRLEIHFTMPVAALFDAIEHGAHKLANIRRRLVVIRDTQAAADVNVTNLQAVRFDLVDQFEQLVHSVKVRRDFGDLRADMAIDADHVEMRHCRGSAVGGARLIERDAEFVRLQARGNIGMRLRIHIRIHA